MAYDPFRLNRAIKDFGQNALSRGQAYYDMDRQRVSDDMEHKKNALAEILQRAQIERAQFDLQGAQRDRQGQDQTRNAMMEIMRNRDYLTSPQAADELLGEVGRVNPMADLPGIYEKMQPKTSVQSADSVIYQTTTPGIFGGSPSVKALTQKTPEYDLKETDTGYTYFPKAPGGRPVPTGVKGKPSAGGHGGGGDELGGFTPEEIDLMGATYNLKGTLPALGMKSSPLRMAILKSAAQQALKSGQGAGDIVSGQADIKGMGQSVAFQEKQIGAMGSFVKNLDMQVDKVAELAKDIKTFDTRLLNIPLRAVRGKIAGSPQQAKYDMYLAEIESEIGKLATGSSASVSELSVGAQEKWAKIHDKNLSINDMLSLLEETKTAGRMRMRSVEDQLEETRKRMRQTGKGVKTGPKAPAEMSDDELLKALGGQ